MTERRLNNISHFTGNCVYMSMANDFQTDQYVEIWYGSDILLVCFDDVFFNVYCYIGTCGVLYSFY